MTILETLNKYKKERKTSRKNRILLNILQIAPIFLALFFAVNTIYSTNKISETYKSNLITIDAEYKNIEQKTSEEIVKKYENNVNAYIADLKSSKNIFFFQMFLIFSSMIFVIFFSNYFFDKKTYYKEKIIDKKYIGSIYEFLDKDCHITLEVVSDYKAELEKQLLENREFNVSSLIAIIDSVDDYNNYKKKKQELQDTKDALLNTDTKTGEILREINSIGNQI